MKVSISQIQLAAMIARGGAVAPKNSPIPILGNARLVAADGNLSLATSDMDRFAEATAPAEITEEGSTTVDAAALATLIGKHPKTATIELELDAGHLLVKCGRSKVKLPTISVEGFPKWADAAPLASFTLRGDDFERGFTRVRFAAGSDPARPFLHGVCLDAHDAKLHFAATDGHRMAVSGMEAPAGAAECPRVTVPTETVDAALKVFKGASAIAVTVSEKAASFEADGLRLSGKLLDTQFPDYARVIPARGNAPLTFRRADFVDCLDRANVLTGDGAFSAIVARPDGDTLRLEARNHKGGEAIEELPAIIDKRFQPFGFNPRYAAQFLATLNVGELTFEQSKADAAHLIYSDDAPDFVGALMPMRVAV